MDIKRSFKAVLALILVSVLSLGMARLGVAATGLSTPTPIPGQIMAAGVHSSIYGIEPFPRAAGWEKAITTMSDYFPGSIPTAIWIVGTVSSEATGVDLEFPTPQAAGKPDTLIRFAKEDRHESLLSYFDKHGIQVYLQVEPGFADVETLIDLVLDRYEQHPCVIGFGIDVEWYQNVTDGDGAMGVAVTDAVAQAWEKRVKAHNENYRLFLKHWDPLWMPPVYRGDIVFVDDGQMFASLSDFVTNMKSWADTFYPNLVMFQYGYPKDRVWWGKMANPVQEIGQALSHEVKQPLGLIWVDFTLTEVAYHAVSGNPLKGPVNAVVPALSAR